METLDEVLVDRISKMCVNKYRNLPKKGKPTDEEWTVLSCIVELNVTSKALNIVALGTGSKCIGGTKLSPLGNILNDSHAEVFARRAFLLYLYDNIEKFNKDSIFTKEGVKYKLKDEIQFIFYSSQMPCGDASIMPKIIECGEFGDLLHSNKRPADESLCHNDVKKQKTDDIHRTGAKCLPEGDQDLKQPGVQYHIAGQVRTKPGRGDRTLSVSCSDKMARWIYVGIQGSLLSMVLLEPIYIKHFLFGGGTPYSEDALKRALLHRNKSENDILGISPNFYQSSVSFYDLKRNGKERPAPGSIVWVDTSILMLEVAVQGKKLGVTKKKSNSLKSSLCISKYQLYNRFIDCLKNNKALREILTGDEDLSQIPYNKMKEKSISYYNKWCIVKDKLFKNWTVKPLFNFCINFENAK